MALSVQHYQNTYEPSDFFTKYVIKRLINENQLAMNEVIDNLGIEKHAIYHLKKRIKNTSYKEERKIFEEISQNTNILKEIRKNIEIRGVLNDMEKILQIDPKSKEFKELENKIINVGEYPIE